MVKYHVNNWITRQVQDMSVYQDLTEEEHERLYSEIKNATLQGLENKLKEWFLNGEKKNNTVQSLLLWVLGLVHDKPTKPQKIKNPGSMADIDSDIPNIGREKVYDYICQKYGLDKVAHVATFGTMAAKGAIRNAARALGYSIELQNKVAKFIPELPGVTIQDSIDTNSDFKELIGKDKEVKHIIDTALKLEGLPNSVGKHAAACVLSDLSLTEYLPLMNPSRKDAKDIMTQFEYKDVESNFVVKYDLLGLQTLDIIMESLSLIKKYKNIDIDLNSLDVNDEGIYKLLCNGHNAFIFQFVSNMFRDFTIRLKPESIHDLSAITSCLRPGCMSNGLHEQYLTSKNTGNLYSYDLKDEKLIKKVQDICKDSYSIMLYQEQVLACFMQIAGWDEIASEAGRRALGKKLEDVLKAMKDDFIAGGIKNGYEEESLSILFDKIVLFSG
jgi:DNA polymerase-3 subunit alpha